MVCLDVSLVGGSNHAVVPLSCVLFWRRVSRKRSAPSRKWSLWACLSEPLCIAARGRPVLIDSQCGVGLLQSCHRLPACLSRRQLQSARDPARARPRGGRAYYVAHAGPRVRTVPRRAVIPPARSTIQDPGHGSARIFTAQELSLLEFD